MPKKPMFMLRICTTDNRGRSGCCVAGITRSSLTRVCSARYVSLAVPARKGRPDTCSYEAIVTAPAPRYDDAVMLLHSLSGPRGIRASASSHANYAAVFARDAVMAGIAGLLIEDPAISLGLRRTLEHLRDLQGPEGQIASNY